MNPRKSFSFKEAYKFTANSIIDNAKTLLLYSLLWTALAIGIVIGIVLLVMTLCIPFLSGMVPTSFQALPGVLKTCFVGTRGIFAGLALVIILALSSFGINFAEYQLLRFASTYYEGKTITLTEIFTIRGTRFFKFWAARLLFQLKVVLGLILFIIPGIYFAYTYLFSGYAIFEGKTDSIGEDARMSAKLSHTVKLHLFFAIIIPSLLFGAARGFIIFFLGPIYVFVLYNVYKQLQKATPEKEQVTA